MTELEPLLQTSSDETELALLRSLAREEPSAAAMAKTAAALGLGTSALTAAGSATAASAVTAIGEGLDLGPGAQSAGDRCEQRSGRQRRCSWRVLGAGARSRAAPVQAAPVAAPQQVRRSGKSPTRRRATSESGGRR